MAEGERLSGAITESLLTAMAYHGVEASPLLVVLTPEMFDGAIYQDIASRIIEYRNRFKEPPAPGHLDDIFDHILGDPDHKQYRAYNRILVGMREQAPSLNVKYLVDRVFDFARSQRLKAGLIDAGERFSQGGEGRDDAVEEILQQTLKQRVDTLDYGERLSTAPLSFLDRSQYDDGAQIRTGINELDRRGLVPTKGEVYYLMAPRKRGKCISGNSLVLLPDGRRKKIFEVVRDEDPEVLCLDIHTNEIRRVAVAAHKSRGRRSCLRVVLNSGAAVVVTRKHPLLTPAGWRFAEDLQPGDFVAAPQYLSGLGQECHAAEKMRLLGYLIADGGLTNGITFSKTDLALVSDFKLCVAVCGGVVTAGAVPGLFYVVGKPGEFRNEIKRWLSEIEVYGKKSNEKRVPEFVFTADDKSVSEFLQTLISCDGHFDSVAGSFEFSVSSSGLAHDVRHLLLRLGITSRVSPKKVVFQGRNLVGYARLMIRGQSNVLRFLDVVGWRRSDAATTILAARAFFEGKTAKSEYSTRPLSRTVKFFKLKKIEKAGQHSTYDLSVDEHHNFIVDDVVVHNSWWLQYLDRRAARQAWNVVHITLENRTPLVKQRFVQSWVSAAKRNEPYILADFVRDKKGKLEDIDYEVRDPRLTFDNPKHRPLIERDLNRWKRSLNRIVVKEWPSSVLTIPMLERWLDGLEASEGFIPDMICLDYPQLMKLDPKDLRGSFGRTTVELRRIAGERNVAMCLVMQSNREGEKAKLLRTEHVAEDISQIATADTILTYNRTEAEKNMGLARLFVAGGRADRDGFTILISQSYNVGQFHLDSVAMPGQSYWEMLEETGRAAERENVGGEREAGTYDEASDTDVQAAAD